MTTPQYGQQGTWHSESSWQAECWAELRRAATWALLVLLVWLSFVVWRWRTRHTWR